MYRALLICNSRFPDDPRELSELNGPKMDGVVLRDALTDHTAGMFEREAVHYLNEADSQEAGRAVDDFFGAAEPDDTLLLYYSGHSRIRNQQLFLCARNTVVDRLSSTALAEYTLNGIISNSFAQVKMLILDCSYGGLFRGHGIMEGLSGTGRYVIAGTSARDSSHRGEPSPFTRTLAEGLLSKAKDQDGDGVLDLDDLYSYLHDSLLDDRPYRSFDGSGAIRVARRASRILEKQVSFQTTPRRGHAFLSYVHEDSDRVDRLQRALMQAGVPVWRDKADLWPGEDWRVKIRQAIIDDALVFIACFSNRSLNRQKTYQNEELMLAIEQLRLRRPDDPWLIPVLFDNCDIPDLEIGGGRNLRHIHCADLAGDRFDEGAARLGSAVLRILARHSGETP